MAIKLFDAFRIASEFGLLAAVVASSILGSILIVRAGEFGMGRLIAIGIGGL